MCQEAGSAFGKAYGKTKEVLLGHERLYIKFIVKSLRFLNVE